MSATALQQGNDAARGVMLGTAGKIFANDGHNLCLIAGALQTTFTSCGPTQTTVGGIKEMTQAELREWGVFAYGRRTGGANSNLVSNALLMARNKWRASSGAPARKFIVLGNHCIQRGVDIRAGSPADIHCESVLYSVVICGGMGLLPTIYQTLARCLGTASQVGP